MQLSNYTRLIASYKPSSFSCRILRKINRFRNFVKKMANILSWFVKWRQNFTENVSGQCNRVIVADSLAPKDPHFCWVIISSS